MFEWLTKWSRGLARRAAPPAQGDQRKACCRIEANLGAPERVHPDRSDSIFRRCRVCSCRHFEFTIDVGTLGVAGKSTS